MSIARPKNFAEFIGKQSVKARLQTLAEACLLKKQPFPHTLFHGPAGVGKTTMAGVVANAVGARMRIVQGPNVEKTSDLLNVLSLINKNDVLFIDEIHALEPRVMEFLFPAMEDFCVDIVLGKEFNSKLTRMKIPPFTLIGATTQLGRVVGPLEERFGSIVHLDYYEQAEIEEIVSRRAKQCADVTLSAHDIAVIAMNSRFVPRNALRLTDRVLDYRMVNGSIPASEIMAALEVMEGGIGTLDVQYLTALARRSDTKDETLGIKAISLVTGIDQLTIEAKIEPYLLRMNYVEKTGRGRRITKTGLDFIKRLRDIPAFTARTQA